MAVIFNPGTYEVLFSDGTKRQYVVGGDGKVSGTITIGGGTATATATVQSLYKNFRMIRVTGTTAVPRGLRWIPRS